MKRTIAEKHRGLYHKPQFYLVITNRDSIKLVDQQGTVEKRRIWEFLDEAPEHFLTSLKYVLGWKEDLPSNGTNIYDCGAWSYKDKPYPTLLASEGELTPELAVEKYITHARKGDIVCSPDMIILRTDSPLAAEQKNGKTLSNAGKFIRAVKGTKLEPMAVAHGNFSQRVIMVKKYVDLGYKYIAIGSVAIRSGNRPFVRRAIEDMLKIREKHKFKIHVLGVSALSWIPEFMEYGIDSFDGSSMYMNAFGNAVYFWPEESTNLLKKYDVRTKPSGENSAPLCSCKACTTLRSQGIDTRMMGSNENNMGRAAHNINMYMRVLKKILNGEPIKTMPKQMSLSFD